MAYQRSHGQMKISEPWINSSQILPSGCSLSTMTLSPAPAWTSPCQLRYAAGLFWDVTFSVPIRAFCVIKTMKIIQGLSVLFLWWYFKLQFNEGTHRDFWMGLFFMQPSFPMHLVTYHDTKDLIIKLCVTTFGDPVMLKIWFTTFPCFQSPPIHLPFLSLSLAPPRWWIRCPTSFE